MPGVEKPLAWKQDANGLTIDIPQELQDENSRPGKHAYVFKIETAAPDKEEAAK